MRSISRIGIAAAVAGACGYVAAGTTNVTAVSIARESADLNTAAVTFTNMAGGELALSSASVGTGQRLAFTPVASTTAFSVAGWTPTFTCAAGGNTVVFQIADASSTSAIIYDVRSVTGTASGTSCLIPSIAFSAASMRVGGSTGTNVQIRGDITVVNTGATVETFSATTIASVGNSFTVTAISTFDAVIDVTKSRITFASGADDPGYDRLTLQFAPTATRTQLPSGLINSASLNVTLTASTGFQFLQEPSTTAGLSLQCTPNDGPGVATATGTQAALTTAIALSPVSGDCKTLTASFNNLTWTGNSTVSISLGRSNMGAAASVSTAYASNTYTAAYSLERSASTLVAANSSASISAGAWTQNGANSMRLNYVPLTDGTSLQVLISNNSSVAGVAEFVAYSGGATCTGNLGAVSANGVTSIGGALRSALRGTPNSSTTTNCTTTFDDVSGNAVVVLSTTTPGDSTKIHSGFTVTGDTNPRQILINSTNVN